MRDVQVWIPPHAPLLPDWFDAFGDQMDDEPEAIALFTPEHRSPLSIVSLSSFYYCCCYFFCSLTSPSAFINTTSLSSLPQAQHTSQSSAGALRLASGHSKGSQAAKRLHTSPRKPNFISAVSYHPRPRLASFAKSNTTRTRSNPSTSRGGALDNLVHKGCTRISISDSCITSDSHLTARPARRPSLHSPQQAAHWRTALYP